MRSFVICVVSIMLLAGLAFADGQDEDSLNVRIIWEFPASSQGLAMTPDTCLWTTNYRSTVLIEVIASDTSAIDTNFYEIDSVLHCVLGIVDDSMLITWFHDDYSAAIRVFNIEDTPPTLVNNYDYFSTNTQR